MRMTNFSPGLALCICATAIANTASGATPRDLRGKSHIENDDLTINDGFGGRLTGSGGRRHSANEVTTFNDAIDDSLGDSGGGHAFGATENSGALGQLGHLQRIC
jgi:hypothetical protein